MKLMQCVFFPFYEEDGIEITLDDNTTIKYTDYAIFENDFKKGSFVAPHLKKCIANLIYQITSPVHQYLATNQMVKLAAVAYSV
ncbi:Hypothetical protein HVR_LOCUS53 [uncultured virus]|nr:Hypothetical protein HVR_LOCUS53 [uncultured virus]